MGRVSDQEHGSTPPQNPYGGQAPYRPSSGEQPYGQPPATGPYPQQQPPASPYAQPPTGSPYSQPPAGNPYGQPPSGNPYGQPPQHGAPPYGQQPPTGPLGDGLDMYGRPLGTDERPGTVTAAAWITWIFSGLTALLYGFLVLAMLVAKDEVLDEINRALAEQGGAGDFDAEDAFGVVVVVLIVFAAWCVIACILAVMAMRRSNVGRILLVVSAVVAGGISLIGIQSVISGLWLVACVGVVILLFTGGAGDWYAGRRRY
jgi:hypothetical protein